MTAEQQRIAIAEWCGWTCVNEVDSILYGVPPEGYELPPDLYEPDELPPIIVPDYLNDLNAIWEAESKLSGSRYDEHSQISEYLTYLIFCSSTVLRRPFTHDAIDSPDVNDWDLVHAASSQRAEALLRTIGKWEESPQNK